MTYSKLHLYGNNTEQCTCTREMQIREKSQEYNYIVQLNMYTYTMDLDMSICYMLYAICHLKQTLMVRGTKADTYIPYEYVNFQTKISVCIQIT
jgi:hypothetical protein